jgi:hypothetical protein
MPPLPPVPGVIRLDLKYTNGTDLDLLTRLHFAFSGGPLTNSQANSWAESIIGSASSLDAILHSATEITLATVTDLSTSSAGVGSYPGDITGSLSGDPLPLETAFLCNYQISRRYRGGRPRSYLPAGDATKLLNSRAWTSAFVTLVGDTWNTFISNCVTDAPAGVSGVVHSNVTYYGPPNRTEGVLPARVKTYSTKLAVPLVDTINSASYSAIPSSQRRRSGQKR